MTIQEFLEQFSILENNLFSLAPDFNKRQGLFNLLKHLKNNNKIDDGLLKDLLLITQTRNKIVSTPTLGKDISDDMLDKITKVKAELNM